MVSESLCFWSIGCKEINDTLHHVGRIALSRMDSGTDEYTFLVDSSLTFGVLVFAGDSQVFTLVASQGPC